MKLRIILPLFFQFIVNLAMAADPKPAPSKLDTDTRLVLHSISDRYKKLKNWRATFGQDTLSVGLGKGTFNEGHLEFVAPNKFLYTITRPEPSDFISNGKEAWQIIFRKGRGKPAFVRHFKDIGTLDLGRYLLMLRGIDANTPEKEAELTRLFDVKGKVQGGDLSLDLIPKSTSDVSRLSLIFKNQSEAPYRVVILDAIGNTTTVTITNFETIRTPIDDVIFRPQYEKGSEIEEIK